MLGETFFDELCEPVGFGFDGWVEGGSGSAEGLVFCSDEVFEVLGDVKLGLVDC